MKHYRNIEQYSVFEINGIMQSLREKYDIVRLVDVEECRTLEITAEGDMRYTCSCFSIWNRKNRCANCTSLRACMTHSPADKSEHLGMDRENIHSVPVYLEMKDGEVQLCVIECVRFGGTEGAGYAPGAPEEYINEFDVLTRLYSHEKLLREIRSRLSDNPGARFLMVMLNIRNFKMANRLFGVEGGNRLLTGIADLMRETWGPEEVYGRFQDDRFVLLVKAERFDAEAFSAALQSVRERIDSPIFRPQVKLGIYEIPGPDMPVARMIEHAEMAVNSIRDSRDTLIARFQPGMMARKVKAMHVLADFEQALEDGEFHIYIQPQVDYGGRVYGGEALVRWIRPDGSMVYPGDFLPVLRQSELLSHLDVRVWEKAVKLLSRWRGTEFDALYLSVNVDPTDFLYLDVPATLRGLCEKYGVSPRKLRVEITENAVFEDAERKGALVDDLRDAGFLVEIDDFGKGFSSLSLLKDIRADVLKIDMGFIQGSENRQRGQVILESIIDMARNLAMGIITEGVETREQVESLNRLGCSHFQGYYFSRPIPVGDFEAIARETMG